jgi:hypothetical protein
MFVIDKSVTISIIFFGLGVTNDAAKPDRILPIDDDGECMRVVPPASSFLFKSMKHCSQVKQQLCQKCKHR